MTKDFAATQQSVVEGAAALREAIPDVIKGYGALGAATGRSKATTEPCGRSSSRC
jgi:hypothetical protein